MQIAGQSLGVGNGLLAFVPAPERARVLLAADAVPLVMGERLVIPDATITHVYFPVTGFISLLTPDTETAALEIGLVGDEGMFGSTLLLGIRRSPMLALVQGEGSALRIPAPEFLRLAGEHPALRKVVDRYLYVTIAHLAQTAACNRSHRVEARLARWLLMTQDRAHSNAFHITHKFLAYMLGVRRAGVSEAAQRLQQKSLIRYSRGTLTVLDRRGLLAAACGCYMALRQQYLYNMGRAPAVANNARAAGIGTPRATARARARNAKKAALA